MTSNLIKIINYINDNLKFGSSVSKEKIDWIFQKYPVTNQEKSVVYNELSDLKINLIQSDQSLQEKINELFSSIGKTKRITEKSFNNWCREGNISPDIEKNIREEFRVLGYTIVEDGHSNNTLENYGFIDHLDLYEDNDLDSELDSEHFQEELSKLKDTVDKSHNLEYLKDFKENHDDSLTREEALNNLAIANKKLVWKIARRYIIFSTNSFDIDDMYQAGMQGLLKAVERFDISLGFQFSTYATHWIKQSISRSIADYSTTIRLPVHMYQKVIKCIKEENNFLNDQGREATKIEMSQILGISVQELDKLHLYKEVANLTSLSTLIGEEGDTTLGDMLEDESQPSVEKLIDDAALANEIQKIFTENLTEKESNVMNFRFGLLDGETHTLEEVGQIYHLTRERIRQIEVKVLKKLDKQEVKERLEGFYYDSK